MLGKQLTRGFDAYNRLDTLQQANELLDVDYAPDGTLQRTENAKGVVTTYAYDALQRRVGQVRDANGIQAWTSYAYDAQDRLIRVTDPNANPTDYTYDDLGNLLVLTSPDTGTEVRRYDPAGNLRQRTDAKGQVSRYDYDAAGRLTQIDLPGTEDDTLYHYDDCPNGQGRLCSVERGATRLSYRYDGWGQIIALTQQIQDARPLPRGDRRDGVRPRGPDQRPRLPQWCQGVLPL